ncbi:MAG: SCO family protein [Chloroflexota bacterium]|nr:SCO family protein [Chloroflexota bacterium]
MSRLLPDARPGTIAIAAGLGAASSAAKLMRLGAILTVSALVLSACAVSRLEGTDLGATPAPDFTLTDALTGSDLALSSLRGRIVVLSFLYTHCLDTCPLTAERFRQAQAALGDDAAKVEFVAVSVDPAGDTVESVRAFSQEHGLGQRWHYLIGERARLAGVWALYGIGVIDNGTAVVPHNDALYLLDSQGRERVLMHSSAPADTLARNLRLLLQA